MAQASPPANPAPASFLGTGRSFGNAHAYLYVGMVNVFAYVLTAIRSQKWRRTIHMATVTGCFTCTHAPAYVMCMCVRVRVCIHGVNTASPSADGTGLLQVLGQGLSPVTVVYVAR